MPPDPLPITEAQADLLRITLLPGLGPILTRRAIDTLGSPRAVLEASRRELTAIRGVGARTAGAIIDARPALEAQLREEFDEIEAAGARIVTLVDDGYPELLKQIQDPPPVLYVRGDPAALTGVCPVGIVGSRSATHYGIEQAERFAAELARAGLCVVSGGARGVDTAAHRAALRARGQTVAVLGCGLAQCYPPENRELFDAIAMSGGAVVTELPMRTVPHADNFPARNRIISGLSLGTLVIEAPRRSGALITARLAAEDHGREVFALPGRVDSPTSRGCLDLVMQGGAHLVVEPGDILDMLEAPARRRHNETGEPATNQPPALLFDMASLSDPQRRIVECLDSPGSFDEIVRRTGLDAGVVRSETTMLELRRIVVRCGDRFESKIG
ncbi:MAG: DNA-protecting protein DprA [Phycisphaeraceae bacterium]|nr:DNA-protecting protein DprA [Phycisphaeraceae bacterium]